MANSGKANIEVIKRMVGDIRFFADAVRREGEKDGGRSARAEERVERSAIR